jgi:hypothetical protein
MFIGSGETDTGEIIQETMERPVGTPFQLFYEQDMKQRYLSGNGFPLRKRLPVPPGAYRAFTVWKIGR